MVFGKLETARERHVQRLETGSCKGFQAEALGQAVCPSQRALVSSL